MRNITSFKLINFVDNFRLNKLSFNLQVDSSCQLDESLDSLIDRMRQDFYVGDIILFKTVDNQSGSFYFSLSKFPVYLEELITNWDNLDKDIRHAIYEYEFPVTEYIQSVN